MKNYFLFIFVLYSFSSFSQSDIFEICRNGSLQELRDLYIESPSIIDNPNLEGYLPLTLACYYGREEHVKFLVDKVQNINGISKYGTPLMAAVVKGYTNIVDLLLRKKANVNIADNNGTLPIHYAVMFKQYDIIELLIEADANIDLEDNRGNSALDYANIIKDEKILILLKNKP
ncbi:MAG: ankyrin repeat domain-containing protein [Bacteroidia bacterium]|nr:ankyrin repeat domain-containing protein [Bacteroidia bacterium]